MKKLFLIRHAKSSWDFSELTDFERPLNKRGRRDAPFMAKLLAQQGVSPDLIISSPATRAITTARYFCEPLSYSFHNLTLEPRLYGASVDEIIDVICNIDNTYSNLMLFSHNPGLTDFADQLSDKPINNIPTCGIVAFSFNIDSWNEINNDSSEILFFEYPKKYFK
ncbi:MAG: histidine phosphatase family protein [Ignavibacteriales bacterium]|nr:MAG: histidine phosphatase family protein [Ignavibacteriales bacterium]